MSGSGSDFLHQLSVPKAPRFRRGHTSQESDYGGYKKVIALDSKYAWAHHGLGVALHGKGQVDEAIACFRKALQLRPDLAAAKKALDAALKQKGGQLSKP